MPKEDKNKNNKLGNLTKSIDIMLYGHEDFKTDKINRALARRKLKKINQNR